MGIVTCRLRALAGATAMVGCALAGVVPAANASPAGTLDVGFTTKQPATGSGVKVKISYASPDGGKPSPVRKATISFPPGSVLDGSAVPSCPASDAELMAQGRSACPAASRLGGGTLEAITGFGPPADPVMTDVTLYNAGDEVIELVQQSGTNQTLAIDRAEIAGNRYISHPPSTPGGPPDGETAVLSLDFTFDTPKAGDSAFFTTPPTCPSGTWTSTGTFTFDSGTVESVSRVRCNRPRARVRLSVVPGHVEAGESQLLRFRLRSTPLCRADALIRMGVHHVRTDRRGRATLRTRMHRVGRHRVVVRKRGCPTARTAVVVNSR